MGADETILSSQGCVLDMPGYKDYTIIRDEGRKEKLQMQFLVPTINEAHTTFQGENHNTKVRLSKFAELRQLNVAVYNKFTHSVCLCHFHENIRLLLVALKAGFPEIPLKFRTFIVTVICSLDGDKYMTSDCHMLKQVCHVVLPPDHVLVMPIEWKQLETVDLKAEKVES